MLSLEGTGIEQKLLFQRWRDSLCTVLQHTGLLGGEKRKRLAGSKIGRCVCPGLVDRHRCPWEDLEALGSLFPMLHSISIQPFSTSLLRTHGRNCNLGPLDASWCVPKFTFLFVNICCNPRPHRCAWIDLDVFPRNEDVAAPMSRVIQGRGNQ